LIFQIYSHVFNVFPRFYNRFPIFSTIQLRIFPRFSSIFTMNCGFSQVFLQRFGICPGPGLQRSHSYDHATIAQSDLCGFTQLASDKREGG
jgi:hypothetical protein